MQKENINGDFNVPFSGYIKKIPIIGLPVKKNFRENSIELLGTKGKNFFQNDGRKLFFNKTKQHGGLTNNFELDYDKPKSIKIDFDLAILNLYQNFYRVLKKDKELVSPLKNAIKNEELISK